MNAYMGYDRILGPKQGAILIFAKTSKEAKLISYKMIHSWFSSSWIDVSIKKMDAHHLFKHADQLKLMNNIPHIIDDVEVCYRCQLWGEYEVTDGLCECCRN